MNADVLQRAESVFDHFLGFHLGEKEYEEQLRIGKYGFEIPHMPLIKLISVQGKTENWGPIDFDFGESAWNDIEVEQVSVHPYPNFTLLYVPPTLFGTPYTAVKAKYTAGLQEFPLDVQGSIQIIASLIEKHEIDEWNCQLPVSVLDVIEKYKRKEE